MIERKSFSLRTLERGNKKKMEDGGEATASKKKKKTKRTGKGWSGS